MRWRTRLLWAALGWTGVAFAQGDGEAGEAPSGHPVELDWQAPKDCPEAEVVLAAVQVPPDAPGRLVARAAVVATGEGYHLTLLTEQDGQAGRRELVAGDCGELAEVTAALLSLALHSSVRDARTAPSPEAPQPAPALAPAPVRSRLQLELGARAAVGALPRLSAGPVIRLALRRQALRIEAGAFGLATARDRVSTPGASYYQLWAATFGGCLLEGSAIVWGGCLGADLGIMGARSEDVTDPRRATQFWLAPAAALVAGVEQEAWSLFLRPGLSTPLIRPSYEIRPYGTVFQPGVVVGSAEVVFGARF